MDDRVYQIRVGFVVVSAIAVLTVLVLLTGKGFQSKNQILIKTDSAPGVSKNTPVRRNGVLIGRVFAVETTDNGVALDLRIFSGEKIYENEYCQIGTASFLGDAVLEIVPGTTGDRGEVLQSGDLMKNVIVKRNPLEVVDVVLDLKSEVSAALDAVRRGGNTVESAGNSFSQLAETLTGAVGENEGDIQNFVENVIEVSNKVNNALDSFNALTANLNDVVGDQRFKDRFKLTVDKFPDLVEEAKLTFRDTRIAVNDAREVVGDVRDTISRFGDSSESLQQNLENLEQFTSALGQDGPEVIANVNRTVRNIEQLVNQLNEFATALNQSEGTIGRLVKDPTLYNNANRILTDVQDVTARIRPLVNDLRTFGDQIARDPSRIIRRTRPTFKGNPSSETDVINYSGY